MLGGRILETDTCSKMNVSNFWPKNWLPSITVAIGCHRVLVTYVRALGTVFLSEKQISYLQLGRLWEVVTYEKWLPFESLLHKVKS